MGGSTINLEVIFQYEELFIIAFTAEARYRGFGNFFNLKSKEEETQTLFQNSTSE